MSNGSASKAAAQALAICAFTTVFVVRAQTDVPAIDQSNPLVAALVQGQHQIPLLRNAETEQVFKAVFSVSSSNAPLFLYAWRVEKFEAQRSCGRVAFAIGQGRQLFTQLGGQLNICEDERPPWRQCKGRAELVPPEARCSDGSLPHDTQEVKDAIARAIAAGSLSHEQVQKTLAK